VTWLSSRHATIILGILLILIFLPQISTAASVTSNAIITETLKLTVYFDGFVLTVHEIEVNQSYPTVNVTLLSKAYENMLVLDGKNLPLEYVVENREAVIYSLGTNEVKISYLTQELTSKIGRYWSLKTETTVNTAIVLPESATVISLSDVPEQIDSSNEQLTLVMLPGKIEITYAAEHDTLPEETPAETSEQNTDNQMPWQFIGIAAFSLSIPTCAIAIFVWRHKKTKAAKPKPEEPKENMTVDVEKLFSREKDLRQEEIHVIQFLSEKNGSAFEAELYEKLQLPRTTTWRLLKRIERMEIIDIKKSRRQNIVSIRKKYMKK